MSRLFRFVLPIPLLSLALTAFPSHAQVSPGTPPFGSFGGGPDVINLANLNAHLTIPVLNKPGRGTNFTYNLAYDTSVWYPVTSGGPTSWQAAANFGWAGQTQVATGYLSYYTYSQNTPCSGYGDYYTTQYFTNWKYFDSFGTNHAFNSYTMIITIYGTCQGRYNMTTSFSEVASDGSGYTLNATGSSGSITSAIGMIL